MSLFRKNPNEANYVGGSKNFLDVIKNSGDGNLLIWRQPEEDFNTNSTLIVNPGEEAVFIKNGEIMNVFSNGRYELTTENYPFLSRLRNMLSGGVSTFNCVVYFVRKAHSLEILWGTDSPIQLRDPVQMIATSVKARGSYKIVVDNSALFLTKLLGNNVQGLTPDAIQYYFGSQFQQKIKSTLARALKSSSQEILGVCSEMELFAEDITPLIQEVFDEYGVRLVNFSISAMDIPEDDPGRIRLEEAYSKRREMEIMGDQYRTIKGVEILNNISNNPGAGGIASAGAGIGMGMAAGSVIGDIAKTVFSPMQGPSTQQPPGQQFAQPGASRFAPAGNDQPAAAAPASQEDYMEKLAKMKKMLDMQLIDQAEYDMVKKEILNKMMM